MKVASLLVGVAGLILAACGDPTVEAADARSAASSPTLLSSAADACADDSIRLPISQVCSGRAVACLSVAGGKSPDAPEGCEWVAQEIQFAANVLLYRAVRCAGETTKLA